MALDAPARYVDSKSRRALTRNQRRRAFRRSDYWTIGDSRALIGFRDSIWQSLNPEPARHTPDQRSTTSKSHLARTIARSGGWSPENAWWRACSARNRSNRHDRRSCRFADEPIDRRSSGTPRIRSECSGPPLDLNRDAYMLVRPMMDPFAGYAIGTWRVTGRKRRQSQPLENSAPWLVSREIRARPRTDRYQWYPVVRRATHPPGSTG